MAALVLSLLLVQADPVDRLIEGLGSDEIEVREEASAALRGMGEKAHPALRQALASPDAEVRARASDLLPALPAAIAGVHLFALRNADPEESAQVLRASFQGVDGFEVAHDPRTRTLIFRVPDDSHRAAAEKIITELDRDPQGSQLYFGPKHFGSAEQLGRYLEQWLRRSGGDQK